jgi:hypothetical protein
VADIFISYASPDREAPAVSPTDWSSRAGPSGGTERYKLAGRSMMPSKKRSMRRVASSSCGRTVVRQNPMAPDSTRPRPCERTRLSWINGRQIHPRHSAADRSRESTPHSGSREPSAAAAAGCLPAHLTETRHSLVRSAVLDRTAMGMAGLDIGPGSRPTRDGRRLASPRLRVVLDTPIASARRPATDRR